MSIFDYPGKVFVRELERFEPNKISALNAPELRDCQRRFTEAAEKAAWYPLRAAFVALAELAGLALAELQHAERPVPPPPPIPSAWKPAVGTWCVVLGDPQRRVGRILSVPLADDPFDGRWYEVLTDRGHELWERQDLGAPPPGLMPT